MLITDIEIVPPIIVRLLADCGKLPANITVQFPHESTAHILIAHRLAVPVADFLTYADLPLDESDMEFTGIDEFIATLATSKGLSVGKDSLLAG